MPTVSVIIPAYNRADLIGETLESVFAQTYRDYEIIVVDDGSTDNTKEVLASLAAAGKLRYTYQENAGLPAARNTGIRLAVGKYVAFLDSDDLFAPDKLEKQVAVFEANLDAMLVHSGFSKYYDTKSVRYHNQYPMHVHLIFASLYSIDSSIDPIERIGKFVRRTF